MTTIKSIKTKTYEIEMLESKAGFYYIKTTKQGAKEADMSSPLDDYLNATIVFDIKIEQLEGN